MAKERLMTTFSIREALPTDVPSILLFIRELAEFEKLSHEVMVTEEQLHQQLFILKRSFAIMAFEGDIAIGFALYFYNFSTFVGKNGLYLEDLYIQPKYRAKGYGKQMLLHLLQIAKQQGCGRMEWSVLNWNRVAIYERFGAKAMNEWTVYRMTITE